MCSRSARLSSPFLRCFVFFSLAYAAASPALARPEFWTLFQKHYHLDAHPDWANEKAQCLNCHVRPPIRNAFGKELEAQIDASGGDNLTDQMLVNVEGMDADGDGYTNGEEIRAGFLPGDAKSHPAPHGETAAPAPASSAPLIPLHSFHPAVVHFPIALFLFGFALDALGVWFKRDEWRKAAYWNFLGALVSLCVVLPTGLAALLRLGYGFSGVPLIHLLLASGTTVTMLGIVLWRRKGPLGGFWYWSLLAVCGALIFWTGNYGAQMVYG